MTTRWMTLVITGVLLLSGCGLSLSTDDDVALADPEAVPEADTSTTVAAAEETSADDAMDDDAIDDAEAEEFWTSLVLGFGAFAMVEWLDAAGIDATKSTCAQVSPDFYDRLESDDAAELPLDELALVWTELSRCHPTELAQGEVLALVAESSGDSANGEMTITSESAEVLLNYVDEGQATCALSGTYDLIGSMSPEALLEQVADLEFESTVYIDPIVEGLSERCGVDAAIADAVWADLLNADS